MKFLVLLAAVGYASAASSNAVTCEECQAGAGTCLQFYTTNSYFFLSAALVDRLLSDASVTEQGEILKALVCPQTDDPASCEAAVDMWFGDMATCIYNHFVLEADVCSRLGLCKKASIFTPRDWTCEECTDIIARTADYMAADETIAEGVEYLQGECFCGQDGHTDDCGALVSTIVPLAMPVLAGVLVEQTTELCQEVVGVC